jgi:ABC-2 type transport system permease protein
MRIRRLIGYVPQQLSIDGQLTGYENAWLFARLFDVPRRERRERVEGALAQVGLEEAAGRLASTYSGGMVRMEEAEQLCDRVGLLLNGHLRAVGRPRELEAALGPGATLEDVFRAYAADGADEDKGGCAMSATPAARPVDSAEPAPAVGAIRLLWSRTATLSLLELAKLRHDRTELYTRAVQPALWLLVFGVTFTRIHAIPTPGQLPYLDYLAPGIMAQSALFIAIFYGIQLIWERDFGILTKLLATPTPRAALVAGKAFAAGVRAVSQVVVVLVLASVLGVRFDWQPLRLLGAVAAVMLGSAFFASLSMTIAELVRTRDRLMGIGQAITMPLFFASNALYPTDVMPAWVRAITHLNPLGYEVNALRQLLLGLPGNLAADFAALLVATAVGIVAASLLLGRLAR